MTFRSSVLSMNILIFCAVASTSAFGQFGTPTEPANPVAKAPRIHSLPLPTEAEARIERVLDEPTNIDLQDLTLQEAMKELETQHDINILIDMRPISDAQIKIDRKINLVVSGVSLRHCLKLILGPLGLSAVIENEVLKITTIAEFESRITTRIYPIGDLCATKDDETELLQTLECGLGKPDNGEPKYRMVISARLKSLTVRESEAVHFQIQSLLNSLRDLRITGPIPPEADPFESPAGGDGGLKPIPVKSPAGGNGGLKPIPVESPAPASESPAPGNSRLPPILRDRHKSKI